MRKQISQNTKKPGFARIDVKKRKCLTCSRDFKSEWIGHRICGSCKQTENYKSYSFHL